MDDLAFRARPFMPQDELPTPSSGATAESSQRPEVATDEGDLAYDKILVPIDFSEHSKTTVSYATKTASRHELDDLPSARLPDPGLRGDAVRAPTAKLR